jgi:hypothetical protein
MTTERTDAEIFAATYADYAVSGREAIERLRECSAADFVRLAAFISGLQEDDFERLAAEIEAQLGAKH